MGDIVESSGGMESIDGVVIGRAGNSWYKKAQGSGYVLRSLSSKGEGDVVWRKTK